MKPLGIAMPVKSSQIIMSVSPTVTIMLSSADDTFDGVPDEVADDDVEPDGVPDEVLCLAARVILTVYVFLLPFCAVTVMVRVLVPTDREFEPEMDTFAFESAAPAVNTTDVTELGTLTVYETVPDEKAGVRVPEDNLIPERLLLDDSAVLLTTETLFDADGVPTLCIVS